MLWHYGYNEFLSITNVFISYALLFDFALSPKMLAIVLSRFIR
jgi:hypothetical protein